MTTQAQKLSDSLDKKTAYFASVEADLAVKNGQAELIDKSRDLPLYRFNDGSYLRCNMTVGDYHTRPFTMESYKQIWGS